MLELLAANQSPAVVRDVNGRFMKGVSGNPTGRRSRAGEFADIVLQKQQKPRGRPRGRGFQKGKSGNPAGRPPGLRNRATRAAEALLDGEAEALTRKAVEMALGGDAAALRLCLDRLIAPRRERAVPIALPPVRDAGDIGAMMRAVAAALGRGELAPGEAGEVARVVDTFLRAIETSDFDRRLKAVEARNAALA